MSASEARRALVAVTSMATRDTDRMVAGLASMTPAQRRAALLVGIPALIGYYTLGSAALAADYYDEARADALGTEGTQFVAEPVIPDRAEKIERAVLWGSSLGLAADEVSGRLAQVVSLEVARAHRETVLVNRRRDPDTVGWRRVARGNGCKMCRMLADRGAVYKRETARFATHPGCQCTAEPVFNDGKPVEEAGVMQYVASHRRRTAADRERLREYLNINYPEAHG